MVEFTPLIVPAGSAKNPSIRCDQYEDIGVFFTPRGINMVVRGKPSLLINDQIVMTEGNFHARALLFANDPTTGLIGDGTGVVGIQSNGQITWKFTPSAHLIPIGTTSDLGSNEYPLRHLYTDRVIAGSSSQTNPLISFSGDLDTGIAHLGPNRVSLVAGGNLALTANIDDVTVESGMLLITATTMVGLPDPLTNAITAWWDGRELESQTLRIAAPIEAKNVVSFISGPNVVAQISQAGEYWGTGMSTRNGDVAERYESDNPYKAGTVVVLGGSKEITHCNKQSQTNVIGVISTAPAIKMNNSAGLDDTHPFVALKGRVPVRVITTEQYRPGDLLVTSPIPGRATKANLWDRIFRPSAIFGKVIKNVTLGMVEAVI